MRINFKKEEGIGTNYILDIFKRGCKNTLISRLKEKNQYIEGLENKGAFVTVNGNNFNNYTYSFMATSLIQLEQSLEIFIDKFVESIPEDSKVSFRMDPDITQSGDSTYNFMFRAAIVKN